MLWGSSALEPRSMDFLGHQQHAKKLSPKIALHFKVLCEGKATLPLFPPSVKFKHVPIFT